MSRTDEDISDDDESEGEWVEIPDTAQMKLCRNTHTNKVVDTGGNVVGEWFRGELVITKDGMEILVDEMQDDMDETTMWWSGNRRPSALTADADSGAGLQGGLDDDVPRSDGDANLAPSEGCTTSDRMDGLSSISHEWTLVCLDTVLRHTVHSSII